MILSPDLTPQQGCEKLFHDYYRSMLAYAKGMLHNEEDAHDILMKTWSRLYELCDTMEPYQYRKYWHTSIRNASIDMVRMRKRHKTVNLDDMPGQYSFNGRAASDMQDHGLTYLDRLADNSPETHVVLEKKEMRNFVLHTVSKMGADQRDAIIAHYFHERPLAAIARDTGVLEGTLKSRLGRGRAKLAIRLNSVVEGMD